LCLLAYAIFDLRGVDVLPLPPAQGVASKRAG
jgi:hypothetical protein